MNWYLRLKVASPVLRTYCPACNSKLAVDVNEPVEQNMQMKMPANYLAYEGNKYRVVRCPECGTPLMLTVSGAGLDSQIVAVKKLTSRLFDHAINHGISHVKAAPSLPKVPSAQEYQNAQWTY